MSSDAALRARLSVKVAARARRNEIVGWTCERLKIKIAAAPEGGRANDALEAFLAEQLGLPRRNVRVAVGRTSTRKIVEIVGMEQEEVAGRLGVPAD